MNETAPGPSERKQIEPLPVGTTIMEYTIRSVIGRGGFGIVYLVEHPVLKLRAALKEYCPARLSYRDEDGALVPRTGDEPLFEQIRHRFDETATQLCSLSHPNIVRVLNHTRANNTSYILMDYITGESLNEYVDRRITEFDEAGIRDLLKPLIDSLSYLHSNGLMHRDIAPDNVLIRPDGAPILIDFGTLKAHVLEAETRLEDDPQTAVIGKPFFSPPEQMSADRKDELSFSADVFALSATIYDVLAGRREDNRRHLERVNARLTRAAQAPGEPTQPAFADVSRIPVTAAFAETIDRGLDLNPYQRPQSMIEFETRLFSQTQAASSGPTSDPTSVVQQDTPRRKRRMAVPLMAGLVLAGGAVFGMTRPDLVQTAACSINLFCNEPDVVDGPVNPPDDTDQVASTNPDTVASTALAPLPLPDSGGEDNAPATDGAVDPGPDNDEQPTIAGSSDTDPAPIEPDTASTDTTLAPIDTATNTVDTAPDTIPSDTGLAPIEPDADADPNGGETSEPFDVATFFDNLPVLDQPQPDGDDADANGVGDNEQLDDLPIYFGEGENPDGGDPPADDDSTLVADNGTDTTVETPPAAVPDATFTLNITNAGGFVTVEGTVPQALAQHLQDTFGRSADFTGLALSDTVTPADPIDFPALITRLQQWGDFRLRYSDQETTFFASEFTVDDYLDIRTRLAPHVRLNLSFRDRSLANDELDRLLSSVAPCGRLYTDPGLQALGTGDVLPLTGQAADFNQVLEVQIELATLVGRELERSALITTDAESCEAGRVFEGLAASAVPTGPAPSLIIADEAQRIFAPQRFPRNRNFVFGFDLTNVERQGHLWTGIVLLVQGEWKLIPLSFDRIGSLGWTDLSTVTEDELIITAGGAPQLEGLERMQVFFEDDSVFGMFFGLIADQQITSLPSASTELLGPVDYLTALQTALQSQGAKVSHTFSSPLVAP